MKICAKSKNIFQFRLLLAWARLLFVISLRIPTVITLWWQSVQTSCCARQTFAACDLGESHDEKELTARKRLDFMLTLITLDTPSKSPPRQHRHDLPENHLPFVHSTALNLKLIVQPIPISNRWWSNVVVTFLYFNTLKRFWFLSLGR